jgi:eukaryotic-like serine/threonine-protein kinase
VPVSGQPDKIDRFIIKSVLGRGSQGIVYHAEDPDLNRDVAIKSVLINNGNPLSGDIDSLLAEARSISRLNHTNIVTIYDIGIFQSSPFLVLEYINGQTLQQRMASEIRKQDAVKIMRDTIAGVAAAHQKGVTHCDLKPANIMINQDGQAKVADFGLAFLSDVVRDKDEVLFGTPQYMAPEYIESRQHKPVSDVFSLGLVFYELLTGKTAFEGKDVYQILNSIAHSEVAAPSTVNPDVDERLDAFILKALNKDPEQRFSDAEVMREGFADYLSMDDEAFNQSGADATAQFLLRRMRHKKDFPAFSQTISVLNRASTSETEGLNSVANTILKDFSLTNKVLRLVNSAYYNRSGGKISTISRAVIMLGINTVRSIASALMLFEHLQNKVQSNELKEDSVRALFSGLVANTMASSLGMKNHEEAFLCAMLQKLGKMLVRFYLHEESQAIGQKMASESCSENAAASQVLGTSYQRLGMAIASEWGFPDLIINSMKSLDFDNLPESSCVNDKLQLVSQFSNAISDCLSLPLEQQATALKTLTKQFSSVLNVDEGQVSGFIESSHKELAEFSRLIQFDLHKSRFYQQISSSGHKVQEPPTNATHQAEFGSADSVAILEEKTESDHHSTQKALTDGIQDITNTLTGDYTINQVMQMILETIYRAFSGSRVVLCLKDAKQGCIRARFGYGENIDQVISHFSIPLAYKADVFHVAFKNNVDIKIENTLDEKIKHKIPDWYHREIAARSFTIFPIIIKHSPIALIYIDGASDSTVEINDEQLGLLKTLRNQAILAIRNMQ